MSAPSQKAREFAYQTLDPHDAGVFDSFTLELREALRELLVSWEEEGYERREAREVLALYSPEEEKG